MTTRNATPKSARGTAAANRKSPGLSAGERAAVKERAQELKAEARGRTRADGEKEVLAKIVAMPAPYRDVAERIHSVIAASAPELSPKTWYGLPAYTQDGKVVCHMRMNPKPPYNDRYLTLGFSESANLDEGNMWATSFALKKLTRAEEAKIKALVKKAVS